MMYVYLRHFYFCPFPYCPVFPGRIKLIFACKPLYMILAMEMGFSYKSASIQMKTICERNKNIIGHTVISSIFDDICDNLFHYSTIWKYKPIIKDGSLLVLYISSECKYIQRTMNDIGLPIFLSFPCKYSILHQHLLRILPEKRSGS